MRKAFATIVLFAFMLPIGNGAATAQQDCDNNLASAPGQGKEYNLFKNLAAAARGCTSPSAVTYEKSDYKKTDPRSTPPGSAPSQQEELDRAACRSEGENAARAARGLQPGEYDLFKNIAAVESDEAEKIEQNCMIQRGYTKVQH